MKVYAFSGLGADERVFEGLEIEHDFIPVKWIEPYKKESLSDYSKRLSSPIDTTEEFCLLGVSFGGLIAIEVEKSLSPKTVILISSAETKSQIKPWFRWAGKTKLFSLIPKSWLKPPKLFLKWLFGAKDTALLYRILDDTDLDFTKWAIQQFTTWENKMRPLNCLKIHGTKDKLIPIDLSTNTVAIENGHHFMIRDRSKEISKIINKHLKSIKR